MSASLRELDLWLFRVSNVKSSLLSFNDCNVVLTFNFYVNIVFMSSFIFFYFLFSWLFFHWVKPFGGLEMMKLWLFFHKSKTLQLWASFKQIIFANCWKWNLITFIFIVEFPENVKRLKCNCLFRDGIGFCKNT